MEIWKPIKGYEDNYAISNHGRIKNVKRNRLRKTRKYKGYHLISLAKNGEKEAFTLSRLVAEHFIPNYDVERIEVNHIDENTDNNHVDNLEWVTPKENANHGTRNERISNTLKHKKPIRNEFIGIAMKKDGETIKEFKTLSEAFLFLGKTYSGVVSMVCMGKRKSAYGYEWEYITEQVA